MRSATPLPPRSKKKSERLKDWAACVARGIPSDLYYRLTPSETLALLDELAEREAELERRAILRAGLIAAEIINWSPLKRRGSRKVRPSDFVPRPPPPLGSKEWIERMRGFAQRHNSRAVH